jgi:cytochrome c-type biogenesis protein
MNSLSVLTAFLAGAGSFLAPCVIPLLPAYVGYVLGVASAKSKVNLLYTVIMYVVGFSLVFTIIGATAGGLGSLLREYTRAIQVLGGIAMVIFGLEFLGILHIGVINFERKPKLPQWTYNIEHLRSFFIGIVFALTWTPCVGPFLGAILSLAATTGTVMQGALMLFAYSLGISLPFVVVALTLSKAPQYLHLHKKLFVVFSKVSGVILVIFGLLLVTDTYKYLNIYVSSKF